MTKTINERIEAEQARLRKTQQEIHRLKSMQAKEEQKIRTRALIQIGGEVARAIGSYDVDLKAFRAYCEKYAGSIKHCLKSYQA